MELVAYHIYNLEQRSQVVPWREVTPGPNMVAKYEAFAKGYLEDYLCKKENQYPSKVLFNKSERSEKNPGPSNKKADLIDLILRQPVM